MILKHLVCTSIRGTITRVEVRWFIPNILSSHTFVNAIPIFNHSICMQFAPVLLQRTIWMCFFISWYVATFVPTSLSGNVVGLSKLRSHYWLGGTWCRVKLIRIWLGNSDGLGALSNVCIRGSQPPTVLLPPPQHHSTHCQPCSDCASLSPLPLSFTLLFSQLFLYVCVSLSFSVLDPYCSIKKPYCSPIGILSAPMPVYNTSLRLGDLTFSAFRHCLKSH